MKVVLDTNVLMSAIFFGGAPAKVLDAWRDGDLPVGQPHLLFESKDLSQLSHP